MFFFREFETEGAGVACSCMATLVSTRCCCDSHVGAIRLPHRVCVISILHFSNVEFEMVIVGTGLLVILANHVFDSNRVVNIPLQYIAKDLGFAGNALIQGTPSIPTLSLSLVTIGINHESDMRCFL